MFIKVYNPTIDPNLMIKVVENLKKDEDIENFEILGMNTNFIMPVILSN